MGLSKIFHSQATSKIFKTRGLKDGNYEIFTTTRINVCKPTAFENIFAKLIYQEVMKNLKLKLRCPFKKVSSALTSRQISLIIFIIFLKKSFLKILSPDFTLCNSGAMMS